MKTLTDEGSVKIQSLLSESHERRLADDVLDGLTRPFKELPPKHFYDARGSKRLTVGHSSPLGALVFAPPV